MTKQDFLKFDDLSSKEILALLKNAHQMKKGKIKRSLQGKCLGLIFEKASTRTRISFEVAMHRLGGMAIYMDQKSSQLSRGETYADTARVLSGYLDGLVLRTFSQTDLEEMASYATIPVINGLTDLHHPCQILADLLTLIEFKKDLSKIKIAYVGDGNNMTHSWMKAAVHLNLKLVVSTPDSFGPDSKIKEEVKNYPHIEFIKNPEIAVKNCDVINTDTWFSMGQEITEEKRSAFKPYQVNSKLLKKAKSDAIVLHCLPAHRGEEITDEVIDGKNSAVFIQAENRLYAQMALLEKLMTKQRKVN